MITKNISDWLNQSSAKPIACDNDSLVSKNLNDVACAEPSNAENVPDKKDCVGSVKNPNPGDGTQGAVVFTPKGHKKERMQSGVSIPFKIQMMKCTMNVVNDCVILLCMAMVMSMKFLIHFNQKQNYVLRSSNEPLKITLDLDYFPHQPKNKKNRKSYDKKGYTPF